ncbi:uncharacterized protein LOC122280861 [Carya illinoinensis]|uniref:uncharacterized protein LOC122280861 n=1 Tax=Carya illinoinensis TaxID=32201 RepID=UPI001C71F30F|nr:uncharacterized protein LOC122280861 [Carya illinoinensis]XP_042947862.1 uncharacterized protein LOC122280861 [Carya illinoinensis]XP_042947863.1 uncharacterized protein LOC122280861 [Carya illinoinensis]
MIQRLKHDVVKRIRDGVYHVNVENTGDVVYSVAPRDNSISRESYNLAAACSNEFVLKSLYYFYPNYNQVCHVMEYYQQSLEHWLQENSLFDHQVKNLNPEFLQIIRLLNFENHPIFLSPLQRLCYRVTAYTFLYFGKSKNSFELTLNKKLQKCKWKDRVDKFQVVLHFREKKQRRKFLYDQSAISFMRFARNVIVHLDDNFSQDLVSKKLTAEEVEEELNTCMPKFMPILHEVLVDHGHLMIVLDAVLK